MLDETLPEYSKAPLEKILLVDDDPAWFAATKEALQPLGFDVSVAKDGGQAQGVVRMRQPDLILMEAILAGESGFEICEKLKQQHRRVAIIMVTEIDLDSARNLAERVGADGYLVKPWDPKVLPELMREVADNVWRMIEDEKNNQGVIRFACQCGNRIKEKMSNRGKHATCPDCNERVQVPDQTIHEFVVRDSNSSETSKGALQPLKFVTIKCPSCSTFYRLSNVRGNWRKCPRCGTEQNGSLSIVGAPMSRAALESSLRVLRVLTGKSKGKKMMLPESKVVFGSGPKCHIRHGGSTVSEQHCSLEPTGKGVLVEDLGSEHGTWINSKRVSGKMLLRAGQVLQIGALKFRLIGEDLSVEDEMRRVQKWSAKEGKARQKGVRLIEGGQATGAEAAQVIQQHWNITRKRFVESEAAAQG
jgi:CheY-like chemotaxis protein